MLVADWSASVILLGPGSNRRMPQFLGESILLAVSGGGVGVLAGAAPTAVSASARARP